MAEVNTTASVRKPKKTNAQLNAETKAQKDAFTKGKQVKVSIPALLQNTLGKDYFVCVNDVHVYVPVDGEEHSIPEAHAEVVKRVIANLK